MAGIDEDREQPAMDFKKARQIMVDSQIRPNDVTDAALVSAFLSVPREAFVPKASQSIAYGELEIETSDRRALWTPRDTAKLMSAVDPKPAETALVIAAGAGYETALLSLLLDTAIGIEEDDDLVDAATERFAKLELGSAVAVKGDLAAGLPDQGPFDVIYVCGMVQEVPASWTAQLAEGGRLAVVVQLDSALGRGRIYKKAGGVVSFIEAFDARPPHLAAFDRKPAFEF